MSLPPLAPRTRMPLFAAMVAVAVLYFLAGKLGLSLAVVNTSATAVWPPTGIAIAAVLLFGRRVWPGILLGAFLVNLTTTFGVLSSAGIAVGNTLEALIAGVLVARFAGGARAFERPYDVFKFAILAGLLATNVSATIGTTTLSVFGLASWSDFGPVWLTWWLGDLGGALVVAPALLVWATDRQGMLERPLEKVLLLAITVATALLLFGGMLPLSQSRDPLGFLSFPVLVWAAGRFGPRETVTTVLVLAAIADWGTLRGFGPFARDDQNASLLFLQAFMTVAAVTSDALAAAIVDRRRAEALIRGTEQRLRVVAEEAARVREEFLSIATHELRTPVTGIRGYAQLARRALARESSIDVGGALDTIVQQSDRLAALISQLLDASQLESGTLAIAPMPTDLSTLTRQAVVAARIGETHRFVVDVEPGLWANVDPVRFEEVIVNLIDNARKFSPVGSSVAVRLAAEGDEIALSVSDEGPGIPDDKKERLFERFYRGHQDRGVSGLGLGLYIAREIVHRHGGRIAVTSKQGGGSMFTVAIPRLAVGADGEKAERAMPDVRTGGRILVVEDDPDIRSLVIETLRAAGHEVLGARDGAEGLEVARRERPDLLIVDKLMPRMDGTAFVSEYRATDGSAPIVALCAARDAPQWASSIGAAAYVGKPFDLDELERVIDVQLMRPSAADDAANPSA